VKARAYIALATTALPLCGAAFAQVAPNAGSIQQQIERDLPSRAVTEAPAVRVEQAAPAAPAAADGRRLSVARLNVSGAQAFPEAVLAAAAGFDGPRQLTLGELRAMAAQIAAFYRKQGYFLAQAYIPAQDIKDGVVTIAVLEGRYGKVSLRNSSGVADAQLNGMLAVLHSGDAVAIDPLERALLGIADLPGASVKSTLVPGASVGASDLIVDVVPGERISGSVDADNHGNRYTGAYRAGASLYGSNLTGIGDLLSLRALTSDDGLRYGRAAWQVPLGRVKASAAYSRMHYRLGSEFAALQARGTASVATLAASYPLLRSRSHNLNALLSVDNKTFRDEAGATASVADKKAKVAQLGLNGNARDAMGSGALTQFSLAWTSGELDLLSAAARTTDAASLQTNGRFHKLSFQASRLQGLGARVSLYGAFQLQLASDNLDTSEKIGLGGAAGVRAYPSGEAFGDQGHILNLEVRTLLPAMGRVPGQVQLAAFVDTGSVLLNRFAFGPGQNRRTLSGAGLGLSWSQPNNFAVTASLARKLGNAAATSAPERGSRAWIDLVKYF
jgi:hemolysin activation/secretion protein